MGKKERSKIDYYRNNRDVIIGEISEAILNPKKPAITGLIVLIPIYATYYVLNWVIDKVKTLPTTDLLAITPIYIVNETIAILITLVGLFLLITMVGRLVKTEQGFEAEKQLDEMINRVPFVRTIYNITKVTTDTVLSGTGEFRKPVKLEFHGKRVTAFKTGNKTEDGREILFLPTSPNITSGFVIEAKPEDIEYVDETVESALTRVLSAGFGDQKGRQREIRELEKDKLSGKEENEEEK